MTALLNDITVNGEVIPATTIAAEAQMHAAPKGKPGIAWRAAGRALAIRALLLQEARRRNLTPEPVTVDERSETDDEALIRQLLDEALEPAAPDEASARAAYAATPDRWRAPTLYEAAHILFPARPDDPAAVSAAKQEATAVLADLKRAPRDFDRIARELSACSSRDNGGRLGQVATGDTVPEFEAVLDALAEGEIAAEPVVTRYGVHIIRLDARAVGEVLPYEAAAPRILEMIAKANWARAARDLVEALASKAELSGIDLKAA